MSEDEEYGLIENYLKDQLSGEEKTAFEKLLSNDPALAQKVQLHKMADELVIEQRLLKVNTILLEQRTKKGGNNTKIIIGSLLLATGSLLFFTLKNKKITESKNLVTISTNDTTSLISKSKESISPIIKNKTPLNKINQEKANDRDVVTNSENSISVHTAELLLSKTEEKTPEIQKAIVKTPEKEPNEITACANTYITATVSTNASCKEEANGSIYIKNLKGGTEPYSIDITNTASEEVPSLNIPAGNYSVVINDKKGCTKTIRNISVAEKMCEKEYSFNPFSEEVFSIPAQHQYGTLSVYERSGNLYYTKETEPSEEIRWNGYSKNGDLNVGYFIFVVSLKDGKMIKGGITIVE